MNVSKLSIFQIIFWGLATTFLLGIRVYHLDKVGLYDYDSTQNYLILLAINKGDFSQLFHHASPGFYLFYLPTTWLSSHFLFLEYLSAFLGLATVWLFVRWVQVAFYTLYIHRWHSLLLYVFIGSSTFLVNSGRYFSIENLSGLVFMLCLIFYLKSINYETPKNLNISAFLWGCFYTVNYKAVLFLPILIVLEVGLVKRQVTIISWLKLCFWGVLPTIVCILIGMFLGLAWWKYPAVIISTFLQTSSGEMGSQFGTDIFYYFQYIFYFENPLLWIGLLFFGVWCMPSLWYHRNEQEAHKMILLVSISVCYLAGMSMLLKAPRGLSFVYPFLYFFAFWGWDKFLKYALLPRHSFAMMMLIVWGISYQMLLFHQIIYPYTKTNYPDVVSFLKKHQIKKIATTVSLQIIPFAQKEGIEVVVIRDEKELQKNLEKTISHILIDEYISITQVQNFKTLQKEKSIEFWSEPTLLPPILWLEHSEFTRLSFEATLQKRKSILGKSAQLKLIQNPF